jgi:hypothetical protein
MTLPSEDAAQDSTQHFIIVNDQNGPAHGVLSEIARLPQAAGHLFYAKRMPEAHSVMRAAQKARKTLLFC